MHIYIYVYTYIDIYILIYVCVQAQYMHIVCFVACTIHITYDVRVYHGHPSHPRQGFSDCKNP